METNVTGQYEMTILIPVYNEESNLPRVVDAMLQYLNTSTVKCCVLFINDGSIDNSLTLIKKACKANAHLFYISSSVNHGLSTALKAGIDSSFSPYVGYIDADLQTHPSDFNLLLPYRKNFQLVTGIRANRKDTWGKRAQSKIANGFRRFMTGDKATDTGCPLKVIQSLYARRMPFFDGMHRFIPALLMLQGGEMKEVPVGHYKRQAGTSKYHLWNRLTGPFVDCFVFRWMKKRYISYDIDENNISDNNE